MGGGDHPVGTRSHRCVVERMLQGIPIQGITFSRNRLEVVQIGQQGGPSPLQAYADRERPFGHQAIQGAHPHQVIDLPDRWQGQHLPGGHQVLSLDGGPVLPGEPGPELQENVPAIRRDGPAFQQLGNELTSIVQGHQAVEDEVRHLGLHLPGHEEWIQAEHRLVEGDANRRGRLDHGGETPGQQPPRAHHFAGSIVQPRRPGRNPKERPMESNATPCRRTSVRTLLRT